MVHRLTNFRPIYFCRDFQYSSFFVKLIRQSGGCWLWDLLWNVDIYWSDNCMELKIFIIVLRNTRSEIVLNYLNRVHIFFVSTSV